MSLTLSPEDLAAIADLVVVGLQQAQTQGVKGGIPVPRGHPGTVTTAADAGGTLWVAPDADPDALVQPPPIPAKNTYGGKIDVGARVLIGHAADGSVTVSELLGGDIGTVPAVGQFLASFNTVEPGYLMLGNGAQYAKSDYPRLWAWRNAAPAGVKGLFTDVNATTFGMANLAGRAIVIAGTGTLTARVMGDLFGEEKHLLTIAEIPSHHHGAAGGGGFVQSVSGDQGSAGVTTGGGGYAKQSVTADTGGGQSSNVIQPSIAINGFIKW